MITASAPSPPPPPTASGRPAPSNPASPALRCRSRGSRPLRSHSSTCGSTSRSAKARTVFRSCSRSGVCQMSVLIPRLPLAPVLARASLRSSLALAFGRQKLLRDVDVPAAQPLAEPLGLGVEPRLIRDALAEDAVDDEVDGPQVRQQMASDGQI